MCPDLMISKSGLRAMGDLRFLGVGSVSQKWDTWSREI